MSQPSGASSGNAWLHGAAFPPRRGLAERQDTALRGSRDPALGDDGLGRCRGAGSLARFEEPPAPHSRLVYQAPPSDFVGAGGVSDVDEVRELSSHLSGFIGRARALEQRSLVLRQQLEKARRLAGMRGPQDAYFESLRLTEERLEELRAEERRLRDELEAARAEEEDYECRWKSESDDLERLGEELEQLRRDSDEALCAHVALHIETRILQEDAAITRDVQRQRLAGLGECVELVGEMMSSAEALSPYLALGQESGRRQQDAGSEWQGSAGGIEQQQQQVSEWRGEVEALSSQQRALQDECERLERNLREREGAGEAELGARRVELAQALGTLRATRTENERLWASARDLEAELDRYRRAVESEDSRLRSVITGAVPATVHDLEGRWAPELVTRAPGRAAQPDPHSVTVRVRERRLAESTSPMEDPCSGRTASRDDVFEEFKSEDLKQDRSATWTGRRQNDEEEEEEAGGDVPDGAGFSRAYSMVKNLIREKLGDRDTQDIIEMSSSDEDIMVYTVPSTVCVSGQASWPQPSCYHEPCHGHVVVVDAVQEDEEDNHDPWDPTSSLGPQPPPPPSRGPLPSPPPAPPSDPSFNRDNLVPLDPMLTPDPVPPLPPAPPSAPDAEHSREPSDQVAPAPEVGHDQKEKDEKGKDEKWKDKGVEPRHDAHKSNSDAGNEFNDAVKKSKDETTPSPPQEAPHEVQKNKSATGFGSRAPGRHEPGAAGEFTSSSISYEKLEVTQSTETTVDDKRQDYEEKSLVIETSVERKETFASH